MLQQNGTVYDPWIRERLSLTQGFTFWRFVVKDNGTAVGDPVEIDQTQAPRDDWAAGVFWRHLGVFAVESSTLSVELGAGGAGCALADAVRLVRHDAPPATTIALDTLAANASGQFVVQYIISGTSDAPPFDIGIYRSTDGIQPGELVQRVRVDNPALLTTGQTHVMIFDADMWNLATGAYLIAKLDDSGEVYATSRSASFSQAFTGALASSDGTGYVFCGSDGASVNVTQDSASGTPVASVNGAYYSLGAAGSLKITMGNGTNTVNASGIHLPMEITGGSGDDTIYGGDGNNWIDGGDGNDHIYGGSGTDWLFGGDGDDEIEARDEHSAVVHGGPGDDTITGGFGYDDLYGDEGNDYLYGRGLHDILDGGPGHNDIQPGGSGLASRAVYDYGGPADYPDANGYWYKGVDTREYVYNVWMGDWSTYSGARLSGGDVSVAVYATWASDQPTHVGAQEMWTSRAWYQIWNNDLLLDCVEVNQRIAPSDDSPEPDDPGWQRLGVYVIQNRPNVPGAITVVLTTADPAYPGGMANGADGALCLDSVMIHPIWPSVNVNMDQNGDGKIDDRDEPLKMSGEATIAEAMRTEVDIRAALDALYAELGGSGDWSVKLQVTTGAGFLHVWDAPEGGNELTIAKDGTIATWSLTAGGTLEQHLWLTKEWSDAEGPVVVEVALADGNGQTLKAAAAAAVATDNWTDDGVAHILNRYNDHVRRSTIKHEQDAAILDFISRGEPKGTGGEATTKVIRCEKNEWTYQTRASKNAPWSADQQGDAAGLTQPRFALAAPNQSRVQCTIYVVKSLDDCAAAVVVYHELVHASSAAVVTEDAKRLVAKALVPEGRAYFKTVVFAQWLSEQKDFKDKKGTKAAADWLVGNGVAKRVNGRLVPVATSPAGVAEALEKHNPVYAALAKGENYRVTHEEHGAAPEESELWKKMRKPAR